MERMPLRFLYLIDWKAWLTMVGLAAALEIDWLMRFLLPIVGGIVWVFLKPIIIRLRHKWAKRKK
jgi:hypothetical protein